MMFPRKGPKNASAQLSCGVKALASFQFLHVRFKTEGHLADAEHGMEKTDVLPSNMGICVYNYNGYNMIYDVYIM